MKDTASETLIAIETSQGKIVVKLYDQTPLHKTNFLKLVDNKTYEGTLFHRVIKDFMIQAGDPDSKGAPQSKQLGMGDVGYTIPAEINAKELFHKKGALCAARQSDKENKEKRSSGCQFYIVTGNIFSEEDLLNLEQKFNENRLTQAFNNLVRQNQKKIFMLRKEGNEEGLYDLQEELFDEAQKKLASEESFSFTPQQIQAYTTIGGTPHLDNEYTVFGEVVEGMSVIDKIQKLKTNRSDRPEIDVVIKKVEQIKE